MLCKLNKDVVSHSPDPQSLIWEACSDLIVRTPLAELSPAQKIIYFALVYEMEVFNGGHLQYFHNQGTHQISRALSALEEIGAEGQYAILESAARQVAETPVERVSSLAKYSERAGQGEFRSFDEEYYACRPEVTDLLVGYVQQNIDEFVEWE